MSKLILAALQLVLFFTNCKSQSLDSLVILIKEIQRGENDSVRISGIPLLYQRYATSNPRSPRHMTSISLEIHTNWRQYG